MDISAWSRFVLAVLRCRPIGRSSFFHRCSTAGERGGNSFNSTGIGGAEGEREGEREKVKGGTEGRREGGRERERVRKLCDIDNALVTATCRFLYCAQQ